MVKIIQIKGELPEIGALMFLFIFFSSFILQNWFQQIDVILQTVFLVLGSIDTELLV